MAFSLELSQKLQQKLSLQMVQNLQTAAMSITELRQKISEEAEKNPVIEVSNDDPLPSLSSADPGYDDTSWSEGNDTRYPTSDGQEASDNAQKALENTPRQGESLQDHLLAQLGLLKLTPDEEAAGKLIISDLDGNGFFKDPLEEVLTPSLMPLAPKMCSLISRMEPVGCAVPGWKESVAVQAEEAGVKGDELDLFRKMLSDERALELLARGKNREASERLAADEDDLASLFAFLRTLTPHPGRSYDDSPDGIVIPDMSVKNVDGNLVLDINNEDIPTVSINPEYLEMARRLKKAGDRKEDSSYLKQRIREAQDLIDQIAFRQSNIEKLGRVLVARQADFFRRGPKYLASYTQRQCAEDMGVSESTVSRLAQTKHIATDWGVLPVKSLFSMSAGANDASRVSVRQQVKEIIDTWQGPKKLSDQKIADILKEKYGITIARRTVAKYRAELSIGSSFDRTGS